MSNDKKSQSVWMMLGGIAGGVIGAAAALLFAPKAGKELVKGIASPFSRFFKKVKLSKTGGLKAKKSALKQKVNALKEKGTHKPTRKRSLAKEAKVKITAAKKAVRHSKKTPSA